MVNALAEFIPVPLAATVVFIAGIVLLLLGGHWLVSGSVTIARRSGISTLVVGLTVVALGTSSPELFFNVIAALGGNDELSFGNVVGSNIANIGLVLGLSALITPLVVHGRVISKELPWLILISGAMIALALLPPSAHGRGFGRIDGVLMLIGFATFMVIWFRMGKRDVTDPLVKELGEEAEAETGGSIPAATLLVVGGLVFLIGGGKLSELGAVEFAGWLGLSKALIGLTIVSVATSMPELATSIIALRKGHHDLAVGNVVGSNLLNLLLVLGLTSTLVPVAVPAGQGLYDLIAMTAITLLLLPMAITHRHKISRGEGGLLLLLYAGYMAWRVVREVMS